MYRKISNRKGKKTGLLHILSSFLMKSRHVSFIKLLSEVIARENVYFFLFVSCLFTFLSHTYERVVQQ
jgi:hypothetical protein